MMEGFANRREAGWELARALSGIVQPGDDVVVLALPRGGVPVAAEVAKALGAPLDLWLVRKLGVPWYEELALGAIAFGDVCYFNPEQMDALHIAPEAIHSIVVRERQALEELNQRYRRGKPPPVVTGSTVIVVDDGMATGSTMHAAVTSLRQAGAARILVAIPVSSRHSQDDLEGNADTVISLLTPELFQAVGQWYRDFSATSDAEVLEALQTG